MTAPHRSPPRPARPTEASASARVVALMLTTLSLTALTAFTQAQDTPAPVPAAEPGVTASKIPAAVQPMAPILASDPAWHQLTAAQQTALEPLAAKWPTLRDSQKRKWIAIAAGYSKLTPTDQGKIHTRMTEWVSLSQQQRTQARLNFFETKKLEGTQKAATWQAYQELTPAERKKLASLAAPKRAGATAAVRPVSPQKMPQVPATKPTAKWPVKVPPSSLVIDRLTLLPRPAPATLVPVPASNATVKGRSQ